jgi:hypothetical protein
VTRSRSRLPKLSAARLGLPPFSARTRRSKWAPRASAQRAARQVGAVFFGPQVACRRRAPGLRLSGRSREGGALAGDRHASRSLIGAAKRRRGRPLRGYLERIHLYRAGRCRNPAVQLARL